MAQDQPLITQIDVVGAHKVEEATVRFKLKSRVGDRYSPETVREDIKALYSLGFFEDIVVQADIFEGGLKLTFVLHEKPSIQTIRIVGNRKLTVDKIKAKIDLVEGGIVPPGALGKNSEKIRLFYEEEGYYQARVDGVEERISPQEVNVTFNIVEGDKFDVGEIRIIGNKYLNEKDIKSKLQTSEVFLFFFGGTLKREELRRDLDRIRAYYLDNGFLDIAVEEPEIQLDTAKKKLRIFIRVQEGPQYRIAELALKGNHLLTEFEIRGLIKSRAGGIFSRETLQGDVTAITDRYAERGYLFADVAPITDVQRADTTVNVTLEITEGRQAYINRIEIAGNSRTRDKVIRREIPLLESNVFNSSLLQAARRNIQALGYFEDVKVDTKRAGEDRVDVIVDVKEKPTGAFSIGGGYSSVDGPIGLVTLSQNNLFGLGQRASISAQLGQSANRGNVLYSDPHLLDTNFSLQSTLYANTTKGLQNNQLGYNQSNAGGAITVGHHLVELVFANLTYGYQHVHLFDVSASAPELVIEQAAVNSGYSDTSAVTLALSRSTLDSPDPTRGLAAIASFEYAGGFLGGSNNFIKTSLDLSQYFPLWWKLVGHLHGNIAYAEVFGDTPFLPAQERYYLGGLNSVRGFKNYTIGPRDPSTDNPEGGTKAYYLQSEVLFPLYDPLKMKGLVFFDVGNAFAEGTPYNFTVRAGTGAGVIFTSPLGQITVEVGIPINRLPTERQYVLHFTAGKLF